MDTVWIVEAVDSPEGGWIAGVFSSRERAKTYMEEQGSILNEGDDTVYRAGREDLYLSSHEVDEI